MVRVRAAADTDLEALTEIYNHYVMNTAITFDVRPFAPDERRQWLADHSGGRYRLLVAEDERGVLGYATTSRWRPKPSYDTTVESTVYCRPDAIGRGVGRRLYDSLFDAISGEDIQQIVAGVALPNAASVTLHERVGFRLVGIFTGVGRKFDRYWDVAWFQRPVRRLTA